MKNSSKIILDALTFDDLLILPGYTDFKRADVSLATLLHPDIPLSLPVCSSPMDTVTESAMAIALGKTGGLGIIHRNLSIADQAAMVSYVRSQKLAVGAACGTGSDFEERVRALSHANASVIVIDSGHGYTKYVIDAVRYIKKNFPTRIVMAGNIATADGAKALIKAGADILRVGMGPGSICTTRIVTGVGVPQITAIQEVVQTARSVKGKRITVVADGGIRQIGDMAKALGCGAHAVMLGSLLAGFDQSPADTVRIEGKDYKQYRGMGSVGAMKKGSAERYGQSVSTGSRNLIPEGVEGLVRYKGSVVSYLEQIAGSLRSAFYYTGAKTVEEFHRKVRFVRITPASMEESRPHSVTVVDPGINYSQ
jgi:IMP dehydrogenase